MRVQAPPTLQQLAIESLLKKEAVAISALPGLPWLLFPATFEVAFRNNQTNILRAMVPAWPLTCLPVGALMMEGPHLETWKALLDGLDVLITEEASPSSGKIRVLDLASRYFATRWKNCDWEFSHQVTRQKKQVETCPYSGVKKYLNVVTDLNFLQSEYKECYAYLWQWAQQRKGSVHLCCRQLEILFSDFLIAIDFLKSPLCKKSAVEIYMDMAPFGLYLRQMRNLHTLKLHIRTNSSISESEQLEKECMNKLVSQLPKLHCLQHLYIHYSNVLVGSLADCLRCTKKPLESLSITYCLIIQRDLDYLPRCLNLSVLKHLDLSCTMFDRCIKPLSDLLETVKGTLQTLNMFRCGLGDSHFRALMPALSQCSQLLEINFSWNELSLPVLKQLLHHTAKLNKLTKERYPIPLDCYDGCRVPLHRLDEVGPELLDILRSERQLKAVSFGTFECPKCQVSFVYDLNGSRYWGNPASPRC
ncbi:LOW QUALITY PROTEIN: hypothetical protein U0070_011547, partial [Myodes glareolus]